METIRCTPVAKGPWSHRPLEPKTPEATDPWPPEPHTLGTTDCWNHKPVEPQINDDVNECIHCWEREHSFTADKFTTFIVVVTTTVSINWQSIVDDAFEVGLLAIRTDNWVEQNLQQHNNNKFTSSPLSIIYYYLLLLLSTTQNTCVRDQTQSSVTKQLTLHTCGWCRTFPLLLRLIQQRKWSFDLAQKKTIMQ